jgi:hypothetical protein
MKQKRPTPEEIIKKLREAEALIAAGRSPRNGRTLPELRVAMGGNRNNGTGVGFGTLFPQSRCSTPIANPFFISCKFF